MFFPLKPIEDHKCCQLHEVVEAFFSICVDHSKLEISLFPEWIRTTLSRSKEFYKKFQKVHEVLHTADFDVDRRRLIYQEALDTNCIQELCSTNKELTANVSPSSNLGKAIKSLMDECYKKLDIPALKNSENQRENPTKHYYNKFIELNLSICPFCGIERFQNPFDDRREDFDHFLPKSRYPLAAANLKNLPPTCSNCNQSFKKDIEVLKHGKVFCPFNGENPTFSVQVTCEKEPKLKDKDHRGIWNFTFIPDPIGDYGDEISNWNRIYQVEKRLSNHLKLYSENWAYSLVKKSKPKSQDELIHIFKSESEFQEEEAASRYLPDAILQAAFFKLMSSIPESSYFQSLLGRQSIAQILEDSA